MSYRDELVAKIGELLGATTSPGHFLEDRLYGNGETVTKRSRTNMTNAEAANELARMKDQERLALATKEGYRAGEQDTYTALEQALREYAMPDVQGQQMAEASRYNLPTNRSTRGPAITPKRTPVPTVQDESSARYPEAQIIEEGMLNNIRSNALYQAISEGRADDGDYINTLIEEKMKQVE